MNETTFEQAETEHGRVGSGAARSGSHLAWLLICVAVPVLGAVLIVNEEGSAALWFAPDHSFPQTCWSRAAFQWDCPFCGLTRSVIYLCHGRIEESLAMHRLGWLVFGAIVACIPLRICYWLRPQSQTPALFCAEWTFWMSLGGLLILNRVVEMVLG